MASDPEGSGCFILEFVLCYVICDMLLFILNSFNEV